MITYNHPTTIEEFEKVYDEDYKNQLEFCDRWIKWCEKQNDYYGVNFFQGKQSALVFHDIKVRQLLRVLKQEYPNAQTAARIAEEVNSGGDE